MTDLGPGAATPDRTEVERVRAFTRVWSAVNDILDESYLGTPYVLAEARVLYELARRPATPLVDLRRRLRLDAGYATRVVTRLAGAGLVERGADPADARRQILRVTPAGAEAARMLDERSTERVSGLLAGLPDDGRSRLLTALEAAHAVLDAEGHRDADTDGDERSPNDRATPGPAPLTSTSGGPVGLRPAGPGDLGWVLERHAVLYRREFGWGNAFEASAAHIVAELADRVDDPGQRGWIGTSANGRLGSVWCTRDDATTARLRLLLVEPAARSTGLGRRLVDECLRFARDAGYREIVLVTQDACLAARRIYAAAGFTLVRSSRENSYDPGGLSEDWHRAL